MTNLGLQAEREWRRLRRHLEFADGFWLGFLFTSSPSVADVFRSRLAGVLQFRVASLEQFRPQEPKELPEALPLVLRRKEDGPRYLWMEALRTDPGSPDGEGPWWSAWESFLLRLNERREMLRQATDGGVLLVAPPWVKPLARDGAPDLWSFRSLVLEPGTESQYPVDALQHRRSTVDRSEHDRSPRSPMPSDLPAGSPSEGVRLLSRVAVLIQDGRGEEAVESAVQAIETLRRDPSTGAAEQGTAHWWLAQARLAVGDPAEAEEAISTACTLFRQASRQVPLAWLDFLGELALDRQDAALARRTYKEALKQVRAELGSHGETPARLRDLAVILERLGDVMVAEGLVSGAHPTYEESLFLVRRLLGELGESPELLRDMLISLGKLADVLMSEGMISEARQLQEESLSLGRRLLVEYGESPERLRDISVSLERLGEILRAEGKSSEARSFYEESLSIARHTLSEYGESPRRLRDVSVILERLGDILREEDELLNARPIYEESLSLRQRLISAHGHSPERLWDLAVILERLGYLLMELGLVAEARPLYEESLALGRRLLSESGENPGRLQDLAETLEGMSWVFQSLEDPEGARGSLEEAIQLTERSIELWGTSGRSEADLERLQGRLAAQSPPILAGGSG